MDPANLERTKQAYKEAKEAEARQEEGDDILLNFHLPNGEHHEQHFKSGVTIAFVKYELAKACGFEDSNKIMLRINGRALMDPFSIVDCRDIQATCVNNVEVSVAE